MVGEIESVLEALNEADVRYLVVGGVAVVLHGHLRTTADLDLVVQLTRDNVLRAIDALRTLDYRPRAPVDPRSLAEPEIRRCWIEEKNLMVFSMWSPSHPSLEVDLFVEEPFPFDEVYTRCLRVPLERIEATVIALDDLLALKRRAGRPRDVEDVGALESLRGSGTTEGSPDGRE